MFEAKIVDDKLKVASGELDGATIPAKVFIPEASGYVYVLNNELAYGDLPSEATPLYYVEKTESGLEISADYVSARRTLYLKDENGEVWGLSIDSSGNLQTTKIS